MPRPKKNREESDIVVYSFGIDKKDPKYYNLIAMLEEIDSGARSYVIRQILNSYVNSQTGAPLFGLVTSGSEVVQQPTQQTTPPRQEAPKQVVSDEKPAPVQPTPSRQEPEKVAPVETTTTPVVEKPTPVQPKEEQPKKPKKHSALNALANQFS